MSLLRAFSLHRRGGSDCAELELTTLTDSAIRFTATSKIRKVTLSVEVSAVPPNRAGPLIPPPETEFHIDKSVPVYLFFSVVSSTFAFDL